jgi:hypothetical protein
VDPGWGLVGIVTTDGQSYAFVRHLGNGTERQLTVGETLDGHLVAAIEANGLRVSHNETEQLILVGNTLRGEAMKSLTLKAPSSSRSSSERTRSASDTANPDSDKPPATPFKVPAANSDPAREAILERLRQQRSRTN